VHPEAAVVAAAKADQGMGRALVLLARGAKRSGSWNTVGRRCDRAGETSAMVPAGK
jgi:hypothetical protein